MQNWTKLIPLDLGESPRFENSDSPRSRGIPESSVSPDCLYKCLLTEIHILYCLGFYLALSSIAFLKYTFQGLLIPFGVLIQGSSDGYNEPWEVADALNGLDLDQTKEHM